MTTPFEQSLIGLTVGGKYVVERVVGKGGMGCVALGHHTELGRKVAIKFMLTSLANESMTARFVREGQLAAKLQSEHVVRVFDVGRLDDGTPYMVMEYLEGKSLADELAASGPLPVATTVDYVLQALEAVAEAHALGVVHRDLKPDNLFLAKKVGSSRTVKVLDFGISKGGADAAESHALTQTSTVLGSPSYMSPEQIRDSKSVDARSDVWSIGVVLYELVEGRLPFDAVSVGELFGKIQFVDPAPMTKAPELQAVLRRCLERDPSARFGSVVDLANALEGFASPASRGSLEIIRELLAASPDASGSLAHVAVAKPFSERPPTPGPEVARRGTLGSVSVGVAPPSKPRRTALMAGALAAATAVAIVVALAAGRSPRTTASTQPPPPVTSEPARTDAASAIVPAPSSTALPTITVDAPDAAIVAVKPSATATVRVKPKAAASATEPDRGF